MSAGLRFCSAGVWTVTHQTPSFGFVYLTNPAVIPIRIRWRAYTSSPFWYSDGSTDIAPSEQKTIWFGIDTLFVQFEVNPPVDTFLFAA
jgi:hypothetical protein